MADNDKKEYGIDWTARLLGWLEPWLAGWVSLLEQGSSAGIVLTVVAGVALGLSPLTYPFVPVVVSYASGGKKYAWRRALVLSSVLGSDRGLCWSQPASSVALSCA